MTCLLIDHESRDYKLVHGPVDTGVTCPPIGAKTLLTFFLTTNAVPWCRSEVPDKVVVLLYHTVVSRHLCILTGQWLSQHIPFAKATSPSWTST